MNIHRSLFYLLFLILIAFILKNVNDMENEETLLEEFINKKNNLEQFTASDVPSESDSNNNDYSSNSEKQEQTQAPIKNFTSILKNINKTKTETEPKNDSESKGSQWINSLKKIEESHNYICVHKDPSKKCKIDLSNYLDKDSQYFKRACIARNGNFVLKKIIENDYDSMSYCVNEYGPFVMNNENSNKLYEQDKLLVESIKDNDKFKFLDLLKKNPRKFDEALLYGYGGNVILHEAIYHNATDILHLLLENVCRESLKKKNKDGNTPLNLAVLKKLDWVVDLLLKVYTCYDANDYNLKHHNPFLSAVWIGSDTIFNLFLQKIIPANLLENKKNIFSINYNPLYVAIMTPYKNIKIIKGLLNLGADFIKVSSNSNTDSKTILSELKKQPRNPLNLEIETLLIKAFHNFYTLNDTNNEKYEEMMQDDKYKEYAPYKATDEEKGCSINENYNTPNISYNYSYDDSDKLYKTIENVPLKVLPSNLEKGFIEQTTTPKPNFMSLIIG